MEETTPIGYLVVASVRARMEGLSQEEAEAVCKKAGEAHARVLTDAGATRVEYHVSTVIELVE